MRHYSLSGLAYLRSNGRGSSQHDILHRYRALSRWVDGRRVYDLARRIFPAVLPVAAEILDRARILLDEYDALHAAVLEINLLEAICSYDTDFDRITTRARTEPFRVF